MPRETNSASPRRSFLTRHLRTLVIATAAFGLNSPSGIAQMPPAMQEPALNPNAEKFGEDVVLAGKPIVFIAGKASWDNAFPTLTKTFKTISAFLDRQNLKPAGAAMTIYTFVNDKGFEFQAAVPLAEAPVNLPRGDIKAGQSPIGKAIKFVHRGSYDSMDMLYEAIINFLDEKRIERQGLFVEEYLTDPATTPEDQLVINVFVLVK